MPAAVAVGPAESGAWLASVVEVPGRHTYGRSIRQAERRIREALHLWVDDADQAELHSKIRLPRQAQNAVRRAKSARARVARDQQEAAKATQAVGARVGVPECGGL